MNSDRPLPPPPKSPNGPVGPAEPLPRLPMRAKSWVTLQILAFWAYFTDHKPTFRHAFSPFLALTFVLFCRHPTTNYIFDEQEALLGSPYVSQQQGLRYTDAIYRDFWGLPANASIGSYRPVPNFLWRGMVEGGERLQKGIDGAAPDEAKAWVAKKFFDPEPIPPLTDVAKRSWFQHLFNIFFHAVNAALITAMAFRLSQRKLTAWVAGLTFLCAAILTEAVSGVVGIADVLGGLGALLALAALGLRAHAMPFAVFAALLLGLFSKESAIVCIPLIPVAALLISPLVHPERPARIARAGLASIGAVLAFIVYVELRKRWFPSPLPSELSEDFEPETGTFPRAVRAFMIWFHQAPLPKDPLNNPFVDAPMDLRVAGACRVYARGFSQVLFPWHLAGDYSFPQEPIPTEVIFPESVIGWGLLVLPLGAGLGLFIVHLLRERAARAPLSAEVLRLSVDRMGPTDDAPAWTWWARVKRDRALWRRRAIEAGLIIATIVGTRYLVSIGPGAINKDLGDTDPTKNIILPDYVLGDTLLYGALSCLALGSLIESLTSTRTTGYLNYRLPVTALGLVWLVVSYIPHSNMFVLLPTVRAERLWYFPVLGTTMFIAVALIELHDLLRRWAPRYAFTVPFFFLVFQGARSYLHAMDYKDDLVFWRATKNTVTMSSKAHLNYSVMAGARGQMDVRLEESQLAQELAPDWAMAHVYTGDTLCRMGRHEEAWPHYVVGFEKGSNEKGLISLGLQCLWDTKQLTVHEAELRKMVTDYPGSWLAYLADDTLKNGDKQGGVQKESRGRGYNEGAKETGGAGDEETAESGDAVTGSGSATSSVGTSADHSADHSATVDPVWPWRALPFGN